MTELSSFPIGIHDAPAPLPQAFTAHRQESARPARVHDYSGRRSDWGFFMRLLLWGMRNNR